MLETLIASTGLRRAALYFDMTAAVNRWHLTHNDRELHCLSPEQLVMLLILGQVRPGTSLWQYVEGRVGQPLTQPPQKESNGL